VSKAFQKMMVDDVIIHAETMAELFKRTGKVLHRCREYNFKLDRSKCAFGVQQISILGHVVCEKGIDPDRADFSGPVAMLQNLNQTM